MKLLLFLMSFLSAQAATLRWEDTNNAAGTSYLVSNQVGAGWQLLTHTTARQTPVTLVPGTNTFSLVASNGLLSEPITGSTNLPFRVFTVIIEASNEAQGPYELLTNQPSFVAVVGERRFYRVRMEAGIP